MKSIDWDNLKSAYLKQDHKTHAFIAKFIHGWLPCGTRRKMIEQGKDECPYCGFLEQNEHMLLCQNTKAVYHQGGRVTAMTTQLHRHQGGQATTTFWIGLLKHIMQAKQGQYIPKSLQTSQTLQKKILHEAVEHQLELGAKLTLRGYLSRKWIIELSTSTGQNLTTEQNGHKWARTAISQFWKVTAQSAARTARKEELHREKTQTSAR